MLSFVPTRFTLVDIEAAERAIAARFPNPSNVDRVWLRTAALRVLRGKGA
jgi:hypothetical protein